MPDGHRSSIIERALKGCWLIRVGAAKPVMESSGLLAPAFLGSGVILRCLLNQPWLKRVCIIMPEWPLLRR